MGRSRRASQRGERILVLDDPPDFATNKTALRPLRLLSLALVALPLAAFCVGAALSYRAALRDARSQMTQVVQVVREHAEKVFESQALLIDVTEEIIDELSDAEIKDGQRRIGAQLAQLCKRLEQIADIRIIGADGTLLAAALPDTFKNGSFADRDIFRAPRELPSASRDVYVSDVADSRSRPGVPLFHISRQRTRGDRDAAGMQGVIDLAISPGYFETFYGEVAKTVPSAVALFKTDGTRLARFPPATEEARVLTYASFLRAVAKNPERGVYDADDSSDGRDRIVAYRKLAGVPVYVGVGIERHAVIRGWARTMATYFAAGAVAVAVLLFLVREAQRHISGEQLALAKLRAETALRENTEDQLRQSQKMDAIGRLTGGIAHDFNNLLTIVSGSLDLMDRRIADGDARLKRLLNNAREGATRAALLTQQLLAFARRQPLDPRPTDVNRLVGELSNLLRRTLGESVTVVTKLDPHAWPTVVDPPQLENALVNLAVNARDAMPDGGHLTIATENVAGGGIGPPDRSGERDEYVVISVSDTGGGIAPEILDKVVEPFFTTKPTGQGTGLGLSQVFGFVRQSGGNVAISSNVGTGTTVRIILPRYLGLLPREEPVGVRDWLAEVPKGITILIAEDDADVRALTAESLHDCGYRVVTAQNGADALDRLAHEPDVRLLLTDVVMPVMDGRKLAHEAHKLRPELPVVFMTGYSPTDLMRGEGSGPDTHLLTKPFTLRQLTDKVEGALAEIAARAGAASRTSSEL